MEIHQNSHVLQRQVTMYEHENEQGDRGPKVEPHPDVKPAMQPPLKIELPAPVTQFIQPVDSNMRLGRELRFDLVEKHRRPCRSTQRMRSPRSSTEVRIDILEVKRTKRFRPRHWDGDDSRFQNPALNLPDL